MPELFLPDAQQKVLQKNTEVTYTTGMLAVYTAYHPEAEELVRLLDGPAGPEAEGTDTEPYELLNINLPIVFTAASVFYGLELGMRRMNARTGRLVRGSNTSIGFIGPKFEMKPWRYFTDDAIVISLERVRAQIAVGLTQCSPPRNVSPFIEKWLQELSEVPTAE